MKAKNFLVNPTLTVSLRGRGESYSASNDLVVTINAPKKWTQQFFIKSLEQDEVQKSGKKYFLPIGVYRKAKTLEDKRKKKKNHPHFNEIVKQEEPSLPNSCNVTAGGNLQNRGT